MTEWRAFAAVEPMLFKPDLRWAMLMAMVGNVAGGKKNDQPFEIDDFLPDLDATPVEPMDPLEMKAMAAFITEAFGGTVIRKDDKKIVLTDAL